MRNLGVSCCKVVIFQSLMCCGLGGCTADLRKDTALEGVASIEASREDAGRALLAAMRAQHGGERFDGLSSVCVEMTDRWPFSKERAFAMPWDESVQQLSFCMQPARDNSRMTIKGEDGEVVGIQNWMTYHLHGDEVVFEKDKDTWFWLPTMQYFIEAAFRLQEAQFVGTVGEREFEGKVYDGVFLTWQHVEPSRSMDQYIAWIERDTGRLGMLEYTVRDMFRFVTGTAVYSEYKTYDGVVYPSTITLYNGDADRGKVLHEMSLEGYTFDSMSKDELVPAPGKSARKADQGG